MVLADTVAEGVRALAVSEGPNRRRALFEIRDEMRAGRHTFALIGELDMAGTETLRTAVRERCGGDNEAVVFDLRELTFIDSTGLRALVSVHDLCRERGYDVALIPGRRAVQRVFELTGLTEVLPFRPGAGA
jgi:anti-sigma B factor antagonist